MPRKGPSSRSTYDVCVVGLGYVGLPTACALADSGLRTVGVDARKEPVDLINKGRSPLGEKGLVSAVRKQHRAGRLTSTSDLRAAVANSKAVLIAVQTPFENGKSNLGYLVKACEQVAASLKPGCTVIVESTVPPGTCARTLLPIFRRHGLADGSEFFFAYCPERIAPGDSLREFVNNDRIIGTGILASRERAFRIMKRAIRGRIRFTDILTAETTKLVENAARDVYIAFANDLAKISVNIGVDVREVIELANTHPRVRILDPGPGVGGPCLTKDPYLLLEGLGPDRGAAGTMVITARTVNDSMPDEVLRLVVERELPRGAKVAVLGTAYKADVDDPRNSPSEPVIQGLLARGYDVHAYDPLCGESFGANRSESAWGAAKGAACTLILVAHRKFKSLGIGELVNRMGPNPVVIDAVGIYRKISPGAQPYHLLRLGDGRSSGRKD